MDHNSWIDSGTAVESDSDSSVVYARYGPNMTELEKGEFIGGYQNITLLLNFRRKLAVRLLKGIFNISKENRWLYLLFFIVFVSL